MFLALSRNQSLRDGDIDDLPAFVASSKDEDVPLRGHWTYEVVASDLGGLSQDRAVLANVSGNYRVCARTSVDMTLAGEVV